MGLEEDLLTHTEIESSLEYELERETSMGSVLSLYTFSPPSVSSIEFSSLYNTITNKLLTGCNT